LAPGFRYHVVSMAAIFLALGVGVIIGNTFVQSAIVSQQTKQVVTLQNQFTKEIASRRNEVKQYSDFVAAYARQLENRLKGVHIALIQTGDYPEALLNAREALEKAGATITSSTVIDRHFGNWATARLDDVLHQIRTAHPDLPSDSSALIKLIATTVARGGTDTDLAPLETAHLLKRDGDYTQPADYVIVIGGASQNNESRAESVDIPLITQLKELPPTVIAAEPYMADISYIPALRASEISTIDNVETDIGRVALVLAIKGEKGNYGVKTTASNGILPVSTPNIPPFSILSSPTATP
jgi:hypothetical protein